MTSVTKAVEFNRKTDLVFNRQKLIAFYIKIQY